MQCCTRFSQELSLCSNIEATFEAFTTLALDAVFLYDRQKNIFLREIIRSQIILKILKEQTFFEIIEKNNPFNMDDLRRCDYWSFSSHLYLSRLSMNVCIDRKRKLYVNFQTVPISWGEDERMRYFICTLRFSARENLNIMLLDTFTRMYWDYSLSEKKFIGHSTPLFCDNELEILRLSSLGMTEKEIAEVIHCSVPSIKKRKKLLFERLGIENISQALSLARLHHIL